MHQDRSLAKMQKRSTIKKVYEIVETGDLKIAIKVMTIHSKSTEQIPKIMKIAPISTNIGAKNDSRTEVVKSRKR